MCTEYQTLTWTGNPRFAEGRPETQQSSYRAGELAGGPRPHPVFDTVPSAEAYDDQFLSGDTALPPVRGPGWTAWVDRCSLPWVDRCPLPWVDPLSMALGGLGHPGGGNHLQAIPHAIAEKEALEPGECDDAALHFLKAAPLAQPGILHPQRRPDLLLKVVSTELPVVRSRIRPKSRGLVVGGKPLTRPCGDAALREGNLAQVRAAVGLCIISGEQGRLLILAAGA